MPKPEKYDPQTDTPTDLRLVQFNRDLEVLQGRPSGAEGTGALQGLVREIIESSIKDKD